MDQCLEWFIAVLLYLSLLKWGLYKYVLFNWLPISGTQNPKNVVAPVECESTLKFLPVM